MAKICLSWIKSSAFKILSYAGPSVPTDVPPLPPQNQTANSSPNSKPPSLPKMKLPIVHLIWNPLSPPQNETANSFPDSKLFQFQVKVTFWFWLMYPPPQEWKGWISGQGDILVLADVPPPESEKFFLSKVRFELTDVPLPEKNFCLKLDLS